MSRRQFAWSSLAFGLLSTSAVAETPSLYDMDLGPDTDPSAYDPQQLPAAESEIDYPIEPAGVTLPAEFQPQMVSIPDRVVAGTIVVDPKEHFLYLSYGNGTALRYGVGVGREGFAWSGAAVIGMKRRWPRWVPPRDMVQRDAKARRWANGQPGGPDNPLGARALYLYQDGVDTLYRIHGTNQPNSIGKSVSSGCIRMLNEHVADLYDQVEVGATVLVLAVDSPVIVQTSG